VARGLDHFLGSREVTKMTDIAAAQVFPTNMRALLIRIFLEAVYAVPTCSFPRASERPRFARPRPRFETARRRQRIDR
jgi:hypothetical protein